MNELRDFQLEALLSLADALGNDTSLQVGFQGGTCLHLSYRSPRFSEDLDFLAAGALDHLDSLMPKVAQELSARMQARGLRPVQLSGRGGKSGIDGHPHNPRTYQLVLPAPRSDRPAMRVKVEFMAVPSVLLSAYRRELRAPVIDGSVVRAAITAPLPVATLEAIEADKVVALALRSRPQVRDAFDLGWIAQQRPGAYRAIQSVETSRRFYTASDVTTILDLAQQTLEQFTPQGMCDQLSRFMPSNVLSPAYATVLLSEATRTLGLFRQSLQESSP